MALGSLVPDAGIRDADVNIDGTAITVPGVLRINNPPAYAPFIALNARSIISVPYRGDGLPDQPDSFDFSLQFQLSDMTTDEKNSLAFLEGLRTAGGIHTLAVWKQFRYTYTVRAGQSFLYLPRPDAYSKSYANKTDVRYMAIVKRGVVGGTLSAVTVVYKASVISTDAVTAGQVWISNTATVHPDSGASVALFKFGTAPVVPETVTVDFHPLFNVYPTSVLTAPFDKVGREDKDLYFIETN